ncbi:MAG: HAMP domain-containing histidine kinase [Chloroflexi bacterium]|nr:HAMP domain-containing histidine kinase [Chloroflexota bacterium]
MAIREVVDRRYRRTGPFAKRGDRRVAYRRHEDRAAHATLAFSARACAILAADETPDATLAGLLTLIARIAGARRAAVVLPGEPRVVAVALGPGEDPHQASELATWVDGATDRTRQERATGGASRIVMVTLRAGSTGSPGGLPPRPSRVAIPLGGRDAPLIGLDLRSGRAAARVGERLPLILREQAAGFLVIATRVADGTRERARASAAETERRRFASTVAHELRTPLTGLAGYLDLLLADPLADPAIREEFIERSRRIVESMAELVNDLLEVSRIEAGSLELSEGTVPLADVLVAARDQLEPVAAVRGVGLAIRPPSRLRVAFGDRRAIERIVVNLVGNGVKYTEEGGRVDVDVAPDGTVALVVVRDTGAGIAPEERARVFERFARLDRHRSLPGTGLGLSIARDLARLMGGDIGLASRPGVGSAFILALPGPTRPDAAAVGAALERAVAGEQERVDAASL